MDVRRPVLTQVIIKPGQLVAGLKRQRPHQRLSRFPSSKSRLLPRPSNTNYLARLGQALHTSPSLPSSDQTWEAMEPKNSDQTHACNTHPHRRSAVPFSALRLHPLATTRPWRCTSTSPACLFLRALLHPKIHPSTGPDHGARKLCRQFTTSPTPLGPGRMGLPPSRADSIRGHQLTNRSSLAVIFAASCHFQR
jgi:hypothetical protein